MKGKAVIPKIRGLSSPINQGGITRPEMAYEIRLLGERLTTAQMEREQALQAAGATREDAAGMRGELEALRVQNAALLTSLSSVVVT